MRLVARRKKNILVVKEKFIARNWRLGSSLTATITVTNNITDTLKEHPIAAPETATHIEPLDKISSQCRVDQRRGQCSTQLRRPKTTFLNHVTHTSEFFTMALQTLNLSLRKSVICNKCPVQRANPQRNPPCSKALWKMTKKKMFPRKRERACVAQ
ncbi:hypothetical protein ElyMa_000859600 [Elysia marginata]|uniref:Uncharacterized protein n=1 Tax=Elysia marginata TaxID=1093978 RepID=A0AAV4H3H1_9GAST|nr:hypothetical protein ElyMa_000859600 [Elysia marginata]